MGRSRTVALVAALSLSGRCATNSPRPEGAPLEVTRLGAADDFGPGIVAVSAQQVHFQTARPGHVLLVWVWPDGYLEPVFPRYGGDRDERPAGRHVINAGEVPSGLTEHRIAGAPGGGRPGRLPGGQALTGPAPPGPTQGYWVLIVSDVPTSATELRGIVDRMTPRHGADIDLTLLFGTLPGILVGTRTKVWAAYYAPGQR